MNGRLLRAVRMTICSGVLLSLSACGSSYFDDEVSTASDTSGKVTPPPSPRGELLFSTGFEDNVSLGEPGRCFDDGCWQPLQGTDNTTGFAFPPAALGGEAAMQMLADTEVDAASVGDFISNEIRETEGPDGAPSRVLYSEIHGSGCCGTDPQGEGATQDPLTVQLDGPPGDLYISYWLKFQPDLAELMAMETWRAFFNIKTGTPGNNDGDFRIAAYVRSDQGVDQLHWSCEGDNNAGGDYPKVNDWVAANTDVPVPIGEWFKYEVFVHRSGASDGRVWMAVDGQVICDHIGANTGAGSLPINRIMMPTLYSGSAYPIYQWVDDLQVWSGFPTSEDDPPYAPH